MEESREKELVTKTFTFMQARMEAEKDGRKEFTCPLCGGEAWWGRAPSNGHLRSGCRKCGISMMS